MAMNEKFGLSDMLGEKWDIDAVILNDAVNGWTLQLFPSTKYPDMGYFVVYPCGGFDNICNCNKMARISFFEPMYIECKDSSKDAWVLSENEKIKLVNMLTENIWVEMLKEYKFQLEVWENFHCNLPQYIPMPDYRLLKYQ